MISGRVVCGITKAVYSDVVISTNGGYPLGQNVYQAVKGMTAAEATVMRDSLMPRLMI